MRVRRERTKKMERTRALTVLPVVVLLAVATIVSIGVLDVTLNSNSTSNSTSISVSQRLVTLTGMYNTFPQNVQPVCSPNEPPSAAWPACLQGYTNTIVVGYGVDSFGLSPANLTLTSANQSSVVTIVVQVSTWNTTARITPVQCLLATSNNSRLAFVPVCTFHSATYFVPEHTIANATFSLTFNPSAMSVNRVNYVGLNFNVTNSLGQSKVMPGPQMVVYFTR